MSSLFLFFQASREEYVNVSGLRLDGRRSREIRRMTCQLDVFPESDGSSMIQMGSTKVLAMVYGPKMRHWQGSSGSSDCTVNCQFAIAPFAMTQRRKRGQNDRKATEYANIITNSFLPVINTKLYPNSQIDIHIRVLEDDGGALSCAINATTLALMDAGIAVSDFVVATSALFIQRHALIGTCGILPPLNISLLIPYGFYSDPIHREIMSGGPELSVAILPKTDRITLSILNSRLPLDAFEVRTHPSFLFHAYA